MHKRVIDGLEFTQAELADLSGPAQVALWNKANPKNPINKFADRKTGAKRLWDIGKEVAAAAPAPPPKAEKPPKATPTPKPPKPKGDQQKRKDGEDRRVRRMSFRLFPKEEIREMREGTARFKAMEILARPEGATFKEVMDVTGWNEKQTYEGIRILNVHIGYGLFHVDLPDGGYRIYLVKTAGDYNALRAKHKSPAPVETPIADGAE